MANALGQLRADHKNFARLIELLDDQLAAASDEQRKADFSLMQDMMQYMTRYPALFHHPREDLVFERLVARQASAKPHVDKLLREHRDLADKGEGFLRALRYVVDGELVPRETLESLGKEYLGSYRSHISTEEEQVFPIVATNLLEEDWVAVNEGIEHMADPLFGEVIADDYRRLYEFITRETQKIWQLESRVTAAGVRRAPSHLRSHSLPRSVRLSKRSRQ